VRTGDHEHREGAAEERASPAPAAGPSPAAVAAGNAALGRALGAAGSGVAPAVLPLLGMAGNRAARQAAVQRQPAPRAAGEGDSHLHLDPEIEAQIRAIEAMGRMVTPDLVIAGLGQLAAPDPAAPDPAAPDPAAADPAAADPAAADPAAADPAAADPAGSGATAAATPGGGGGPASRPPPLPADPRPGQGGDIWQAIKLDPTLGPAIQSLQDQAADRARREWDTLSTGGKAAVVSSTVVLTGAAVTAVLSRRETREPVLSALRGTVFPVPKVPGLGVQLDFGGDSVVVGLHLDVGQLLPSALGFGPGRPTELGAPPNPYPAQREAADGGAAPRVGDDVAGALASTRGGGAPLDAAVRGDLERRLDTALPPVRVHTDTSAGRLARTVNAVAFTSGQDIYFSPGAYQPGTADGRRLLAHEAVHTLQQVAGPVAGSGSGAVAISDPADPYEREADRISRSAVAAPALTTGQMVQRQPTGTAVADVLPTPRIVTWSSDKFEVGFARAGDQLEATVRYLGAHKVSGDGARVTLNTGPAPFDLRVLSMDPAGMTIDVYGDGGKVFRLADEARMSTLPGGPGRSHDFSAVLAQRTWSAAATLTVFDPQATPADLTGGPKPENPGANPVLQSQGFGADGWEGVLDGDGDQDKELALTIKGGTGPGGRTLMVTAVQRSSRQVRGAVLPLTGVGPSDWLIPQIVEVTDGFAPTKVKLFVAPEPALLLAPGVHGSDRSTYRLTLGGMSADLAFPAETTARRKIAAAGPGQVAGGILVFDVTLGAYHDPFRLTFRQLSDGKTTFGLSALNAGVPRDTVGTELALSGPIRYEVVDTGPTSLGIDLDGDGKADLLIYDRITTPSDFAGSGPPAESRDHQIRVVGSAVAVEQTYRFHYEFGAMNGVAGPAGPATTEAGRNAEAVSSLAEQGKTKTRDDMLDQIEIAMLAMRRRAADRGLLAPSVVDTNVALWQVLVRLRAEIPTGVPASLRDEAIKAAKAFAAEVQKDLDDPASPPFRTSGWIAEALHSGPWSAALSVYSAATAGLDAVLRDRMAEKGGDKDKDLVEARQLSDLRKQLGTVGGKAIRVAATFHPDEKFRSEQGYVTTLPLQLYVWRDGDEWKLKDVTNPDKPFTYSYDAEPGDTLPPLAAFTKLDDPDHFPSGAVNIQVPGGVAGRIGVRDHLTWKKFFTYLGLTMAAIGLTLSAIASAGATSAAVPAAWALGASALAGATVAGIDLAEHIQHDNLDARTALLDLAQIAAGVTTAGAIAAGRIVAVAGNAPAAARWTGAWAQAAMLAQKWYVPLVVGGGIADGLTVAVMAEGTLRQLEAIEKSDADPGEKSRAKLLLLIQAATMAGLTALQLKSMGPLGRGETLVLRPGPDGIPTVSPAVRAETLIVDANISIALRKRARIATLRPGETLGKREELQEGEKKLLARYDAMNPADTRIADISIGEAAAGTAQAPQRGFAVGVDRASTEYQEVMAQLTTANVGKGKGTADRQIVADAFFAVGEPGVTPRFASMDSEVYKKLYALKVEQEGAEPLLDLLRRHAKKGQSTMPGLPEIFPDGFTVTIKTPANPAGRTIEVIPMPKENVSGLAGAKPKK